jgi:hypothetical protein
MGTTGRGGATDDLRSDSIIVDAQFLHDRLVRSIEAPKWTGDKVQLVLHY